LKRLGFTVPATPKLGLRERYAISAAVLLSLAGRVLLYSLQESKADQRTPFDGIPVR